MVNSVQFHGILFEFMLAIVISYEPSIALGVGGRALAPSHFAVPGMTYAAFMFFYDETRKIYVRRGIIRIGGKARLVGWFARNTLY